MHLSVAMLAAGIRRGSELRLETSALPALTMFTVAEFASADCAWPSSTWGALDLLHFVVGSARDDLLVGVGCLATRAREYGSTLGRRRARIREATQSWSLSGCSNAIVMTSSALPA